MKIIPALYYCAQPSSCAFTEVKLLPKLKDERHERLVQEYMIDLVKSKAARRAGLSPDSAYTIFKRPEVRQRVDELIEKRSERTAVTADRVLQELARLAYINSKDLLDPKSGCLRADMARDDTAAILSVKVKTTTGATEHEVKLTDKLKALELLGRHLGLFDDRLTIDSVRPVVIVGSDDLED